MAWRPWPQAPGGAPGSGGNREGPWRRTGLPCGGCPGGWGGVLPGCGALPAGPAVAGDAVVQRLEPDVVAGVGGGHLHAAADVDGHVGDGDVVEDQVAR